MTARAHAILAVGFAHIDRVFLRRLYILVVIEYGRRRVHLARITNEGPVPVAGRALDRPGSLVILGPTVAVQFASSPPLESGRVRWHDQPDRHVKEDRCLREP